MVRIAGVDVPDRKKAHVALRSIYGIGPKVAAEILTKADLDPESPPRMNELTEFQVDRIREIVGPGIYLGGRPPPGSGTKYPAVD